MAKIWETRPTSAHDNIWLKMRGLERTSRAHTRYNFFFFPFSHVACAGLTSSTSSLVIARHSSCTYGIWRNLNEMVWRERLHRVWVDKNISLPAFADLYAAARDTMRIDSKNEKEKRKARKIKFWCFAALCVPTSRRLRSSKDYLLGVERWMV